MKQESIDNTDDLINLYLDLGMPEFNKFVVEVNRVLENINNESVLRIVEAGEKAKLHVEKLLEFVLEIRNFPTRKDIASAINYNRKSDSALAFSLLDGKAPTNKQYFELIKQNI